MTSRSKGRTRCTSCFALLTLVLTYLARKVHAQIKKSTAPPGGRWVSNAATPPESLAEVASGTLQLEGKTYLVVAGAARWGMDAMTGASLIYSFSDGVWSVGKGRPALGDHHAAEVVNNTLYLFGGCDSGWSPMSDVQIATLVMTSLGPDIEWRQGARMPFATCSASSGFLRNEVYVCGGIVDSDDILGSDTTAECLAYDTSKNVWRTGLPRMPYGRNHAASCTDGAKLFVFGGRAGSSYSDEVFAETQIFTPDDRGGAWSVLRRAPLPHARGGMGKAPNVNGRCYVMGGEIDLSSNILEGAKVTPDRTSYAVDIFDVVTYTWEAGADMPEGLHGIFPVVHQGRIFIATGSPVIGVSSSNAFHEYVPEMPPYQNRGSHNSTRAQM